ncbi:helix-turn-helix domain-containing protein [Maribacter sp. 2-571]|uniref:AraC family transcriptional regulator n=1 Tax=Maribacter sp. 2-571 TaxID=3417569 RepID=UPI003D328848
MATVFFIWGFVQSLVVGILIPIIKNSGYNRLLSLIFLSTSLNIALQYLLRYRHWRNDYPRVLVIPDFLDFLLPALLFLYIQSMIDRKLVSGDIKFLYVPFFFGILLFVSTLVIPDFTVRKYIGSYYHESILLAIFLWKLFLTIKGRHLVYRQQESGRQKAAGWWPKVLVLFLGFLTLIAFINLGHVFIVLDNFKRDEWVKLVQRLVELNFIGFTCSIILITIFFLLKFPKILSNFPHEKGKKKLNLFDADKHLKKLEELVDQKKIFLDPRLSEQKLADKMEVPYYVLSVLLNDYVEKSFSNYINGKRVEEAKRLLESEKYEKYTILTIAKDSGFRTESVFYVNFKKHAGMTPKQYKKRLALI